MFPSPYFAYRYYAPRFFPRHVPAPPDPHHKVCLTLTYRPQRAVSLAAIDEVALPLIANPTITIMLTSES